MIRVQVRAMLVVAVLAGCQPAAGGSTATGSPGATAASGATLPARTATPPSAAPTPVTNVQGIPAKVISLGGDAAPIDIAFAFGSIWVANHHTEDVSRIDPVTMQEIARIPVGGGLTVGPGWFAVLDDSIWVSNQNRRGVTPIDPKTNTAGEAVGSWAPCSTPAVVGGVIWQSACDAGQFMRIDPVKRKATDVPAQGHGFLALAGDTIVTTSSRGLARFDPATGTFTELGGSDGMIIGFDGTTAWISDDMKVTRIDPKDGHVVATLPIGFAGPVAFRDGHAWMAAGHDGLDEIDLATNEVLRKLPVTLYPTVVRYLAGSLWLTSFEESTLWRLDP